MSQRTPCPGHPIRNGNGSALRLSTMRSRRAEKPGWSSVHVATIARNLEVSAAERGSPTPDRPAVQPASNPAARSVRLPAPAISPSTRMCNQET